MTQVITMGVIVDAVWWNFFDDLDQARFVHGPLSENLAEFHARDKPK